MSVRSIGTLIVALLIGVVVHVTAFGAAQLKAGAGTSAKPTAPAGSALRQMQIQFDPGAPSTQLVDNTRVVKNFQLTVGFNSSQVSLRTISTPDYSGTTFTTFSPDSNGPLVGPYPNPVSAPPAFDTYVTGRGQSSALIGGDVNIFSLLWDVTQNVVEGTPVQFELFATQHITDTSGIGEISDFINTVDLTGGTPTSFGPGSIETTIISVPFHQTFTGDFTTLAGNSGLAVPLPAAVGSGCALMLVAGLVGLGWRRRFAVE